jgi:prepilin-type N-terminal cleavage/methylation domain-containing protein
MYSRRERDRHGFSLVELLIVVSIIALLASLLLPGLVRAREYAYFARCKSNLRQLAIGCLLFAGNNRGQLPGGESRCPVDNPNSNGPEGRRKIGDYGGRIWYGWNAGTSDNKPGDLGGQVIWKLYHDGGVSGWNWNNARYNNWVGRPRQPGTYLPIESFWCPIVNLRNWKYGNASPYGETSGNEKDRDNLCRRRGVFGYAFFIHTTGCYAYQKTGWEGHSPANVYTYKSEWSFRKMTNSETPTTSDKPSVWIAADLAPRGSTPWNHHSHFGVSRPLPGEFRFNALHLDGHVHNDLWQDPKPRTGYWILGDNTDRPYGWPFRNKTLWQSCSSHDWLADEPAIDGAFDMN